MPTDWGGGAGAGLAPLVADLGRIQADRTQQQGRIWGSSLSEIGNLIAQAPQREALAQERQARILELQGLAQDRQMRTLAMQREQAGTEALAKAIANPANQGDPEKIYRETAMVSPDHAQKYLDLATKHSEALQTLAKAKETQRQVVADTFDGADPTDTSGLQARLGLLHSQGVDVAPYAQLFDQVGPEAAIKQITESAPENVKAKRARAEKAAEEAAKVQFAPAGSSIVKGGAIIGSVPAKAEIGKPGSFEDYVVRYAQSKQKPVEALTTADIEDARKRYQQADDRPTAAITLKTGELDDVKETVKGMKDGSLPPVMPGRATKEYTALLAEAHRQGFDLAGAATDWAATQKHISTLNGAQQTRLNQAVNQLPDLLDTVEGLANQWKAGRFPLLNKANLALAKGGAFGAGAATIANKLDAQIADVNADLATVYMGGNSPTDRGLELASKALNSNWDQTVLLNMIKQAKQNVQIRQNSIRNTGVQGASATNPYAAPPAAAQPAGQPPPGAKIRVWNPTTGKLE